MLIDNGLGVFPNLTGLTVDYDTGEITSPTHYDLSAPEPQWTKSNGRYVFAGWGAPGAKAVYLPISAEIALNYLYGLLRVVGIQIF